MPASPSDPLLAFTLSPSDVATCRRELEMRLLQGIEALGGSEDMRDARFAAACEGWGLEADAEEEAQDA